MIVTVPGVSIVLCLKSVFFFFVAEVSIVLYQVYFNSIRCYCLVYLPGTVLLPFYSTGIHTSSITIYQSTTTALSTAAAAVVCKALHLPVMYGIYWE